MVCLLSIYLWLLECLSWNDIFIEAEEKTVKSTKSREEQETDIFCKDLIFNWNYWSI